MRTIDRQSTVGRGPVPSSRPVPVGARAGSALMLTLMVVSLLLVLALGFTVFVRMELRTVAARGDRLRAESAARLGMELALARLQELTGPDQRVTARATLFEGTNLGQGGLNPVTEKGQWIGVWNSASRDETAPLAREFLGWLASTPSAAEAGQVGSIGSGMDPADAVALVDTNSVLEAEDRAWARTVSEPLPDGTTVRYAWWVGDEGQKARFDTRDPYRGASGDPERLLSIQAPQRLGVEFMHVSGSSGATLEDENLFLPDSSAFNNALERVGNPAQLPLLGGIASAAAAEAYDTVRRARFHDLTLHGEGLPVNLREGGLQRDLTMAFEMPLDAFMDSEFAAGSPDALAPVYVPDDYPASDRIAPLFAMEEFAPWLDPNEDRGWPEPGPVSSGTPDPRGNDHTYLSGNGSLDPVLRGPPWQLLRNYYRLYKQTDPDPGAYNREYGGGVFRSGGRWTIQGRGYFPTLNGLDIHRRYGQDPHTWLWAEGFGTGRGTSVVQPRGFGVFPAVAPVMLRMQTVLSFRSVAQSDGNRLDMYLDPVVTLWNPYNVHLRTGEANGQPLELSVKFLNPIIRMDFDPPTTDPATPDVPDFWQELRNIVNRYATGNNNNNPRNFYDPDSDEVFRLKLNLDRDMAPGEVMIFTPGNGAVPYVRNETSPRDSGVELDLYPGVSGISVNTGLVFENVLHSDNFTQYRAYRETHFPPNAHVPDGWDLRVRMQVPMEGGNIGPRMKFNVEGVEVDGIEPFMGTILGAVSDLNIGWSNWFPVQSFSSKRPFMYYDVFLKSETDTNGRPVNLFAQYNPRAYTTEQGTAYDMRASAYLAKNINVPNARKDRYEDLYGGQGRPATSWNNGVLSYAGDNAFWGEGYAAGIGGTRVPVFEVPVTPALSIGELQHAPLTHLADEPAFPVGNSLPNPFVGYSKLSMQKMWPFNNIVDGKYDPLNNYNESPDRDDWTLTRPDWSYMLNQVLFDGYFFSGLTPLDGSTDFRTLYDAHLAGAPLANARMRVEPRMGETAESLRDKLFDGNGRPLRTASAELAGNLRIEGAFNINSTSVEAWAALLAAARGAAVETGDAGTVTPDGTYLGRHTVPLEGADELWTGFRTLGDAQIRRLAEEIVAQVKRRGPFLTLGDFVNRQLSPTSDPATVTPEMKAGPLQAAIDAAGLNDNTFNERITDYGDIISTEGGHYEPIQERMIANQHELVAMSANGYITQADLLSLIAPLLTARSDTFRIRAYGEHVAADGTVASKAWCEAVVQRVPDYQDSTLPREQTPVLAPHEAVPDTGTYDTVTPRRRFEIVSFQWLDPEDV